MKRKAAKQPEGEGAESSGTDDSGAPSDSGSQTSSDSGSSGSYPSVSSDAGSDIAPGDETVTVDFEFFDPKEIDFHGLKALLQTYLDGEAYGCSELVEAIIKQATVGTVVKTGESDDPIGVTTVFSTQRSGQLAPLAELRDFLVERIARTADQQRLLTAWGAPDTGLLVSERLVNCPPQLAPPLMRALFDEIQWATEDGASQEERDEFKFKRYVIVTRAYTDAPPEGDKTGDGGSGDAEAEPSSSGHPASKKAKRKKDKLPRPAGDGAIVYVRPEDEYFHKQAAWSCTFPVVNRAVGKDELRPLRLVMLVDASKVAAARDELDSVVGFADA